MPSSTKSRKATAKAARTAKALSSKHENTAPSTNRIDPPVIRGCDDMGHFYASHSDLLAEQAVNRTAWYAANDEYWSDGGYGGSTDDEVMVGDEGGERDTTEGLLFLDRLLHSGGITTGYKSKTSGPSRAMDAGAGVGRVTKQVLLKRFDTVHLVEGSAFWSKQSKVYLGRKRSSRCSFTCARLEELSPEAFCGENDLIWLQWTLQYLTDVDAIKTLRTLARGLSVSKSGGGGTLVVKENRPYGTARSDRFQMDTPSGPNRRYDITRSDAHHRWLFQEAGLLVGMTDMGEETHTYAMTCRIENS